MEEGPLLAVRMKVKRQIPRKVVPAVAPGPALGFGLQETLITHRLLSAPAGTSLSLELLDDVATHQGGAPQELIQSASTLGGNPAADRHPKLWKTLYNWIAAIHELNLDPSSINFVLYVSAPVGGALVDALAAASDSPTAVAAAATARDELWGPAPNYPKRANLPQTLATFVNTVLATDDSVLIPLIINFRLEYGSGSPHEDLVASVKQQIVLDESDVNTVARQMLGWVKQKLEMSLEKNQPAIVARNEFVAEMKAFIRRTALRQILQSFAPAPSNEAKATQRLRTYVRQLELIDVDDTRILGSITDFLKAASERVEWARRGLVHSSSFDELDATLRSVWDNQGLVAEAQFPPDKPIPRGRSLYGNCMNYQAPVQGMTAPDYFLRGCFHRLADTKEIGWHPDFLNLLADKE